MRRWVIGLGLGLGLGLGGCGGGTTCGIVGSWMAFPVSGQFVGQRVEQKFNADGSYEIDLNDAPFQGGYSYEGTRLTITDDGSCPQGSGPGVYDVRFFDNGGGLCQDAILNIVSDDCAGRAETLNGMHIEKPF